MAQKVFGLKIVSDGTPMGTKVFDREGRDVTRDLEIREISFHHRANGLPMATLTCFARVELTGMAVEIKHDEETQTEKEGSSASKQGNGLRPGK